MSTGNLKRFSAFVVLKGADDTKLPGITQEIVSQIRNSDVYASERSEQRFRGRSADAMLAIMKDRERWVKKKSAQYYNSRYNEILYYGLGGDEGE